MRISSSFLKDLDRCKRLWWLAWYRKLTTAEGESTPQNVGNLVHKGLEYLYKPGWTGDVLKILDGEIEQMAADAPQYAEGIRKDGELAKVMVEEYLTWKVQEDIGLEILETEVLVEAPLEGTPFTLVGKLDGRGRRTLTGSRVVLENKTVERFSEIPKTAQINFQFKTYDLLEFLKARFEGDEGKSDGVIVNMFRRVDNQHPTSKPPYFERYEVRYNLEELRNHWKHVVTLAYESQDIIKRLDAGEDHHLVVPPSPESSCAWMCKFRAVCPMLDDGSDAEGYLQENYVKSRGYGSLRT